jgi:endonuclease YncB( thermonuclease family)
MRIAALALCGLALVVTAGPAIATGCAFEAQGEGRVAAVIDARTFRLEDGREVRLAGIEPVYSEKPADRTSALAAIVTGHEVTLAGEDDTPDRYGRQPAFVYLDHSDTLVQGLLLAQGDALVSATVTSKDCASVLAAAEAEARLAKRGTWADSSVTKNAESADDILAGIGRFWSSRARFCRCGRREPRLT